MRFLPIVVVTLLASIGLVVRARSVTPALPTLAPEGGLTYEVRDADTNALIPCKLTLLGVDGTPDPRFTRNDIGRQEGDGSVVAYDRVLSISGVGVVHVPVGSYDVYVSRGPEWDLAVERKVRIAPGKSSVVQARLKHVVDTSGWISADFHVHASHSSDSHVPMHDRIFEFVADGVELITSTDHNVVSNYAPLIDEIGVGRYITSMIGDELTTNGWGHFGAWPLSHDLERVGQGAVLVHGKGPKEFFGEVRTHAADAVIDVHHPRIDAEIGYFNVGGFDARNDKATRPGFSFDFDAVEVLNGYQDSERRSVDRMIDDWFALLQHGHLVTATGNSDTHHLDHNIGGYPRNYVRVQEDKPQSLRDPLEIPRAVKGHHVQFTTGPFVVLKVDGAGIGDVASARGGDTKVELEVRAAPWVSVSTATLYLDGHELHRWKVPKSVDPVRLRETLPVKVQRDAWIVVRVDGDEPLAPVVGDRKRFDVRPLALTNPVFLDVDGNGKYDPPEKHGSHDAQH
ncbi:MAG: CehA/McbA family metallohydrolase [Polyangia bacterium]